MAQKLSSGMNNLSLDNSYILVAAIDFGTTSSGYAFSFKSSPNSIKMNKDWGAELGYISYKSPTCVMTNPDGSFHCFGYQAEQEYSQLNPDEDEIGGPNGYNIYRHFKMLLHGQGANLNSIVVSTTGHSEKAINILTMVLKHLHDHMMEVLSKTLKRPPSSSEIRWVLTVRAFWRDEYNNFMREAAYRAGLISQKHSTELLIFLESEAASIFCRSLEINNFENADEGMIEGLKFKSGEKMLIIDAGGGIVDITAHEILLEGKVKEIAPPSGGPWGGMKVDDGFVSLLSETFGSDFINKFKEHQPQQWLQFMTFFEKAKRAFLPDGNRLMRISLPYSFDEELKRQSNKTVNDFLKDLQDPPLSYSNSFIMINHDRARQLFSEPISKITKHVRSVMADRTLVNLNYILLLGGFGECKMLHEACQQEFGNSVKLLIPVEAQLAVIKGAVLFGHNPMQIHSRIAQFTYGRGILQPFDAKKHDIAKKKTVKDKDFCDDLFKNFITKGEEIEAGTVRNFETAPLNEGQTKMSFTFYRTEKKEVMYVDEPGVTRIGEATLESSSGPFSDNIQIRITFGHTEILVEARDADRDTYFSMQTTLDFL